MVGSGCLPPTTLRLYLYTSDSGVSTPYFRRTRHVVPSVSKLIIGSVGTSGTTTRSDRFGFTFCLPFLRAFRFGPVGGSRDSSLLFLSLQFFVFLLCLVWMDDPLLTFSVIPKTCVRLCRFPSSVFTSFWFSGHHDRFDDLSAVDFD